MDTTHKSASPTHHDDREEEESSSSLPPLRTLAKRSLIHLDGERDSKRVSEIKKDLDQMWNWIQSVRKFLVSLERDGPKSLSDEEKNLSIHLANLSDEDIYDVPRGVEAGAPTRSDVSRTETENFTPTQSVAEAEQVWRSVLEPKTKLVGGHQYFVIATSKTKKS